MAFIKSLSRFNVEANYLSLTRIDRFCKLTREAVFIFSLYKDKATARLPAGDPQAEPLIPVAAKLRLTGEAFERYFGKGIDERTSIEAQAFAAARSEPLDSWAGRLDLTDAADDLAE